jgi:hypothetical protein
LKSVPAGCLSHSSLLKILSRIRGCKKVQDILSSPQASLREG